MMIFIHLGWHVLTIHAADIASKLIFLTAVFATPGLQEVKSEELW